MSMISIGDLAQSFLLRRQNVTLKQQMNTLTTELTTGRKQNIAGALAGDFSYLSDIERSLRVLQGYEVATTEAEGFTQLMQTALDRLQEVTSDLGTRLMSSAMSNIATVLPVTAGTARQDLGTMISIINSEFAGRSLFAGSATDVAPLASADHMLTELTTVLTGETTLTGILDKVDDWFFTDGGGFDTTAYHGAENGLSPFLLGDGDSVLFDMKADDDQIRHLLRNAALAALSADETLGFSTVLQFELQAEAGEALLSAQDGLTEIRSDLGYVQERIDASQAKNAALGASLEIAKNELLAADPYEAATQLEHVQFQLESLYTLTVRMSKLTLASYM